MDGSEHQERASEAEQAAEMVACPYCAEEIKPSAKVCKHCGRDFFLVQPLLEQVRTLSKRVEELEHGMVELVQNTKQHVATIAARAGAPAHHPLAGWAEKVPAISRKVAVCVSLIWVLAIDYLVNFTLNESFGWLQVVIILGPLVCGFLCRKETPRPLVADLTAGAMLAFVAVAAMSYLTYRIARFENPNMVISLLPQDWADWRETIQLLLAISAGFMGGAFARRMFVGFPRGTPVEHDFAFDASKFIVSKMGGKLKPAEFESKLKSVEGMLTSLLTIGTTGVAIAAALGKIFTSN